MQLTQDWHHALDRAQCGELEPALAARAAERPSLTADFFYARCLAENPALEADRYDEAAGLLRRVAEAQPSNPIVAHALTLALLRAATPDALRQAAALLRGEGLPHDLSLLGQMALALEFQMRPLPAEPPAAALPWPAALPRPDEPTSAAAPSMTSPPSTSSIQSTPSTSSAQPTPLAGSDILSPAVASNSPDPATGAAPVAVVPAEPPLPDLPKRRQPPSRAIKRMETLLIGHEPLRVLEMAGEALAGERESAELHLMAGIAAEEAGDALRARAHLARAERLAPAMMHTRSQIARVYWRLGWLDLAMALGRSLPIEGPYDYGRHYLLALVHAAAGDHPASARSMLLAMNDFFYDTRHFYIKRIQERWLAAHSG